MFLTKALVAMKFGRSGTSSLNNHLVCPYGCVPVDTAVDVPVAPVPQLVATQGRAGHPDKSVPWPLPSNDRGLPILPSSDGHNLPEIKHIIRSFLSLTYRMSIPLSLSLCGHTVKFRACRQQSEGLCALEAHC
jgi:hypothetical protein